MPLGSARSALLVSVMCLLGLVITGLVAYLVPAVRVRDSESLSGYATLGGAEFDALASHLVELLTPRRYAVLVAGLVGMALLRGRWRIAFAVTAVAVLAPATSRALKSLIDQPRYVEFAGAMQVTSGSWPSGHSAAAMTLALCGVLVAPMLLRPLAAVAGTVFAVGIAFSMLVLSAHFPTDVVGGFLVAGTWVLLAVAALRRWSPPGYWRTEPMPAMFAVASAVGLMLAAVTAGLALDRTRTLLAHAFDSPSLTASALIITLLGATLTGAMAIITQNDR